MDYGSKDRYPFKIVISVNKNRPLPTEVLDCFQVKGLDHSLGAEYNPSDLIMWV